MPEVYHLDYETKSKCDIKLGAYRYASDPSTRILMCCIARGDETPLLWVHPDYDPYGIYSDSGAKELIKEAFNSVDGIIYAHNAQFEIAISHYRGVKDIGLHAPFRHQWRCTAAMARKAALQHSLEKCAKDLGLEQQKDNKGKALIRYFSCPVAKTGEIRDPAAFKVKDWIKFQQFCDYCRQDVIVEREIEKKLKPFTLKGRVLDIFQADIEINHRGLPVNIHALTNAQKIIDEIFDEYDSEFKEITGGLGTNQREKCLAWFKDNGYPFDNLQSATVEKALAKPHWEAEGTKAYRALFLRKELSYAAVKKVTSMLDCACPDGYVRGTIFFHGARTMRWSGRLIQPHNFKRPTFKNTALAYKMICEGYTREQIELVFGNAFEVISSCIRHFIQPHVKNHELNYVSDSKVVVNAERPKLLDADYAGIENRIVMWLADEQEALQAFRDGVDMYIDLAVSEIFPNVSREYLEEQKALDNFTIERFVGKQATLGCGFQMGAPKFVETCAMFGQIISKELGIKAVQGFRTKYSKLNDFWGKVDRAAKNAIFNFGKVYQVGKLSFKTANIAGILYLIMKLPSGRSIVYPHPEVIVRKRKFNDQHGGWYERELEAITFYGKIDGKSVWGRVNTYGGKLVENATQAVAADIMGNGVCNAEEAGYEAATLIHDQGLGVQKEGQTIEEFCALLTDLPDWAEGLPVVAEGKITDYYTK